MRREVKALEDSNSGDQLAFLVLRVVAELSPSTKTSLIAYVSGGDSTSGHTVSDPHTRELIFNALLTLKALAFIQFAQEQIAITDEGRRFLDKLPVVALRPRTYVPFLRARVPSLLTEYTPRLKGFCQEWLARAVRQRGFQMNGGRAQDFAPKIWKRKVAPIGSRAITLLHMPARLARVCHTLAEAWAVLPANWRGQSGSPLWTGAKVSGLSPHAKLVGRSQLGIFGSALLVVALSTAGGAAFFSGKRAESSREAPFVWLFERPDRSSAPADAGEPDTPATLITPTEAVRTTPPNDGDQKPAKIAATEPSNVQQNPTDRAGIPPIVAEQAAADPIVATIRLKLADPALRRDAQSEDLAALQSFYAERSGPPVWMMGMGLTARAQAVVSEVQDADEWGLSADAFDLPPAGDLPATEEAQATDEIKLGLAILKYARFARGGRLTPSRISDLVDQRPNLLDPKTVLTEISASAAPDAYLRSLHPKQEQFERLRRALLKARAKSAAPGRKPENEHDIQRLIINMERWRWMPAEVGSYYVWNNVPEFVARVVKNGKTIYVEKIIVGQLKYPTPIFSSEMRSIVFHPEWVVPETIIKEDLQPSLQQGGFFGGPSTAILEEHNLKVSYEGRPVDANSIDWVKANVWQYTFTQAPGSDNVLGALKFNFPNKHAIYMHDTVQPELFAETVRALSHGCIRVHEPDRLAALLLAEDKGWSAQQVKSLLAKGTSSVVPLKRPLPVYLTYFTTVVDEEGKAQNFADIYGLDRKMETALFGKGVKLTVEAYSKEGPRKSSWRAAEQTGSLTDSISGLFGN
jgi:murein L,D-transpeptidase YcbB/YkuD